MLLAEEPATLIHHTINNFNIHADKAAVARIKESLSTLQQARDLRLGECEAALKKLSRSLHTVQSEYEDLAAAHSAAAHAGEIARLDTQKFRTAKAASDAETEAERTAQQAADLSARLQQLELQGVDGGGRDGDDESLAATGGGAGTGAAVVRRDPLEDELLLRLKVYRSLGIEVERDERDGEYSRAIVRNDRTGKVQIVNIDKKVSRFFYANLFWQTL